MKRCNPERQAKRKAITDGPQSELCRRSPCEVCGRRPTYDRQTKRWSTDPHHWPTKRRGGTDRDTCPLCRRCHDLFHQLGERRFLARTGVDVRAVAARLAAQVYGRAA